jgi:hypothetical protein
MIGSCTGKDPARISTALSAKRLFIILSLFFLPSFCISQTITDTSVFTTLSRAYSILRIDPHGAIPYFRHAADLDSLNLQAHQMLGYLYYQNERDMENALTEFTAADRIQPSDTMKYLQACVLHAMRRDTIAMRIFEQLRFSASDDIRLKAGEQIRVLTVPLSAMVAGGPSTPWWTRIYFDGYYDTRWSDSFFSLTAEEGYSFLPMLSVYGLFGLSGDVKSSAGALPEIFADNSVTTAVGLRATPFTGFSLSAQEGSSFDLIGRSDISFVQNDFRLVAVYGYGIYAPFSLHPGLRFPMVPTLDVYSSLGAYSKYKNTIGYLQVKGGIRAAEVSKTVVDCYVKINLAHDVALNILRPDASVRPKEYYNNILEWGGGVRLTPEVDWGIYLVAEAFRGVYTNESLLPPSRDRYYSSCRLSLIIDRIF